MYDYKDTDGLVGRLRSLEAIHADLEARIDAEVKRPLPDDLLVQRMKRQRLKAKDEIAAIAGVMRTIDRQSVPGTA